MMMSSQSTAKETVFCVEWTGQKVEIETFYKQHVRNRNISGLDAVGFTNNRY